MAFDDENILQDYIARLLALQDERDAWLDQADLDAAARNLGLTERDRARIGEAVTAHRERARRFSQHDAWTDAITEYRQAVVLAPFDVELMHELAVAYASRFEENHAPEDRAEAERYARRSIDLDPTFEPAYALLAALDAPRPAPQVAASRARLLVALGAAVSVLVAGGIAAALLVSEPGTPAPVVTEPPTEVPATAPPAAQRQRDLPVTFDGAGLRLDVQRALFNDYDSTFALTLYGTLGVEDEELHRLRLRLDLLDANGAVLLTDVFEARSTYEPPLRPGDTAPINHLVFVRRPAPPARRLRLVPDAVERAPAAADYGTARPIDLTWEGPQPPYLDVTVRERASRLTDGFGPPRHFLTLALHNRGDRSVEHLRLKTTWFAADGTPVTDKLTYAVPASGPALRPGQTWVLRTIAEFPPGASDPPFDHYRISVIAAE